VLLAPVAVIVASWRARATRALVSSLGVRLAVWRSGASSLATSSIFSGATVGHDWMEEYWESGRDKGGPQLECPRGPFPLGTRVHLPYTIRKAIANNSQMEFRQYLIALMRSNVMCRTSGRPCL
jgi:hypothetical protein